MKEAPVHTVVTEAEQIILKPDVEGAEEEDCIVITRKALEEIERIRQNNNIPQEYGLRMGVKAGGCSGFMYSLGFDSEPRPDDAVFDLDGLRVFIDSKSLFYLMGVRLDFIDELMTRGFTFQNPRAVRTCGCGNSFSA